LSRPQIGCHPDQMRELMSAVAGLEIGPESKLQTGLP